MLETSPRYEGPRDKGKTKENMNKKLTIFIKHLQCYLCSQVK